MRRPGGGLGLSMALSFPDGARGNFRKSHMADDRGANTLAHPAARKDPKGEKKKKAAGGVVRSIPKLFFGDIKSSKGGPDNRDMDFSSRAVVLDRELRTLLGSGRDGFQENDLRSFPPALRHGHNPEVLEPLQEFPEFERPLRHGKVPKIRRYWL